MSRKRGDGIGGKDTSSSKRSSAKLDRWLHQTQRIDETRASDLVKERFWESIKAKSDEPYSYELEDVVLLRLVVKAMMTQLSRDSIARLIDEGVLTREVSIHDTLLQYFRAYSESIRGLSEKLARETRASQQSNIRGRIGDLRELFEAALRVYGIPYVDKKECDRDSIFAACISSAPQIFEEKLRHYLLSRIILPDDGENAGCLEAEVDDRFVAHGIDSARGQIIYPYSGSYEEAYVLFTVGVEWREDAEPNLVVFPNPESDDVYLRPRGDTFPFLISTFDVAKTEYAEKRLLEAAMNALEYKSIIATADRISYVEPLYLDGRLFPYEHRLDDLFYYHGRYVYRALKEYRNITVRASQRPIIGIVKRPGISILWHFARYVILSNLSNELGIDETALLLTELKSPYIHDGILALRMLMSAKGKCKSQGLVTTFAVIRPYWVLEPKFLRFADEYLKTEEGHERWHAFLERENKPDFWRAVFRYIFDKDENFKKDVENLADLEEEGNATRVLDTLAEVTASRVATFYVAPLELLNGIESKKELLSKDLTEYLGLARWEVMIPPGLGGDHKAVWQYIRRALRHPSDSTNLYIIYTYLSKYPETFGLNLLLPKPVELAHEIVTKGAETLTSEYAVALKRKTVRSEALLRELIGRPEDVAALIRRAKEKISEDVLRTAEILVSHRLRSRNMKQSL
jgi:hypothetical protein